MNKYLKDKHSIIKDKIDNKNNSQYSDAFVFAIKNDIFPICCLHFEALHEQENDFTIKKNRVSDIYIGLQNYYDKKEKIVFNDLNIKITNTYGSNRDTLVDILRYFYLSEKFDKVFWDTFLHSENHPIEVHNGIDKEFDISEIL